MSCLGLPKEVVTFSCRTIGSLTRLHDLTGVGSTRIVGFGHIRPPSLVPSHLQPIIYGCLACLLCRWPFSPLPHNPTNYILSRYAAHDRRPNEEAERVPDLQPPWHPHPGYPIVNTRPLVVETPTVASRLSIAPVPN